MGIHRTAVIDPGARLGEAVEVGPYAVIGASVTVGGGCRIGPHACLSGPLELGEECEVAFSAALGHAPQVKGNAGPFGALRIGRRNVFREFAQVHRSMAPDGATVIGDDGYFMVNSHVGHDCEIGDHVVLTNDVSLGGHVLVQDRVNMGGSSNVAQFSRVGELAMVAGMSSIHRDVPPFALVAGAWPERLRGLNLIGLRRAGIDADAVRALKDAYRVLFRGDGRLEERLQQVEATTDEVQRLVTFVRACERGVIGVHAGDDD